MRPPTPPSLAGLLAYPAHQIRAEYPALRASAILSCNDARPVPSVTLAAVVVGGRRTPPWRPIVPAVAQAAPLDAPTPVPVADRRDHPGRPSLRDVDLPRNGSRVSAPLLWVGPLAIYLASFVIAFSARGRRDPAIDRATRPCRRARSCGSRYVLPAQLAYRRYSWPSSWRRTRSSLSPSMAGSPSTVHTRST